MATVRAVLAALASQIASVTSQANPPLQVNGQNLNINVGVGWPGLSALQNIGNTLNVAITVYDSGLATDHTRWMVATLSENQQPTYVTTNVSNSTIPALGTTSVLLGLVSGQTAPNLNDAVSVCLNKGNVFGAQIYTSVASDTLPIIATRLASQINADPVLSTWVTASAVGNVLTLTNRLTQALGIQSYAGNQDNKQLEVSRINRHVLIYVWTGSEAAREAVSAPIEQLLGGLRANFGVQVAQDNSWVWINYDGDELVEDENLKDVYARVIKIEAEYSVTTLDVWYSVLAPIPTYQTF